MKLKKTWTISCLFILCFLAAPVARADYYFSPHFIITDDDMTDYQSMSVTDIQKFLQDQSSPLTRLILPDYQGITRPVSEIIWQAAQESKINPKVLLTTLQKEQSLISGPILGQNQLDKAMGYRCPDGGVCNPNAIGFGKQVDGAAWQFRQYTDNPSSWTFRIGQTYAIDGFLITPMNQATANLYNYTPHESGNQHFWQIWQNFWGKNFPDGTLVKAKNDPGVWFVQYGTRRLITSWSVLLSRFDPKKILVTTQTDLAKYEIGPPIKFHNYSLLGLPDGRVFLLVDDELRHIISERVFRNIGFSWDEVQKVSEQDLAGFSYGDDVTEQSVYATGALLQDKSTGDLYYVDNGTKHAIVSREIMIADFPRRVLTAVSSDELNTMSTGDPVKFSDGNLVKDAADNKVYVISGGYRRWITTADAFAKFGYRWDNIITTNSQAIAIHPLGADIQ